MAEGIRVGLGSVREGTDLVRALAVRGLGGTPLQVGDGCEVEIVSEREETERLLAHVLVVLEGRLEEHELSLDPPSGVLAGGPTGRLGRVPVPQPRRDAWARRGNAKRTGRVQAASGGRSPAGKRPRRPRRAIRPARIGGSRLSALALCVGDRAYTVSQRGGDEGRVGSLRYRS